MSVDETLQTDVLQTGASQTRASQIDVAQTDASRTAAPQTDAPRTGMRGRLATILRAGLVVQARAFRYIHTYADPSDGES